MLKEGGGGATPIPSLQGWKENARTFSRAGHMYPGFPVVSNGRGTAGRALKIPWARLAEALAKASCSWPSK